MIPLGRWLADSSRVAANADVMDVLDDPVADESLGISCLASGVGDDDREAVVRSLEAQIADLTSQLEQARADALAREAELTIQLGKELVSQLGTELRQEMAALQADIEAAVAESLVPFLEHQARSKCLEELVKLIREAMSDSVEQLVEIKAPADLHALLQDMFEQTGVFGAVIESPLVELQFTSRRVRFESLAKLWIDVVSGLAP